MGCAGDRDGRSCAAPSTQKVERFGKNKHSVIIENDSNRDALVLVAPDQGALVLKKKVVVSGGDVGVNAGLPTPVGVVGAKLGANKGSTEEYEATGSSLTQKVRVESHGWENVAVKGDSYIWVAVYKSETKLWYYIVESCLVPTGSKYTIRHSSVESDTPCPTTSELPTIK